MDIIRDGVSLVLEDGSLQLMPSEEEGGAPEMPTGSGSGVGSGLDALDRNARSTSFPLLPPLPSHVDEISFSWLSNTSVSGLL